LCLPQHVRQLGDIRRDPPRLVTHGGPNRCKGLAALSSVLLSQFGSVNFLKPKSLDYIGAYGSLTRQNLVQMSTFEAVTPRKGHLTPFAFNCGSEQLNNLIIIKYERVTS
jgi:hypothetical protein